MQSSESSYLPMEQLEATCSESHKIGGAFEFCKAFCEQICEAKPLINSSLWITGNLGGQMAELFYSYNQKPIIGLSGVLQLMQIMANDELRIFDVHDPEFAALIVQKNITASAAAFIKLQDFGLLGILISYKPGNLKSAQFEGLLPIVRQFANAFGYKYLKEQLQPKTIFKNQTIKPSGNEDRRNQAEKALKESEERYRLLFENAFDCITIYDNQKAELINCNQATLDYFQCGREEFLNLNQNEHSAPIQINGEPVQSRREAVIKELQINKKARFEWIHKVRDGSLRTAEISSYQLPSPNENIWVTVMHDITENKKAEAALRSSEERLSMILEAGQIGTWDWDMVTGKTVYNHCWAEMLGYELDEIEPNDKSFNRLVHPDDIERVYETIHRHVDGHTPYFELETRMISKSGEVKWIYDRGQVMTYDKEGKPLRATGIHLDITRQKQVEAALLESQAQQNELLVKLEMANKELKDFAYMVSHDLKAPLRAIASLAQWIQQDFSHQMDPQGQQHLQMLLKRADRMHGFIEGILEYSRIGLINSDRKNVDLNVCIQGFNEMFAHTSAFKIVMLRPLPTLLAEKVRMDQLFQNLISNAIKYNDKKLPIIKIQWKESSTHFKFKVSDNGPGIAEQFHKKIFKLFQTLQSRDKFESTGIGLTIVKRIVESYQGNINVHSSPGKGTTFEFTLKK